MPNVYKERQINRVTSSIFLYTPFASVSEGVFTSINEDLIH